jgi:hypothetical protein
VRVGKRARGVQANTSFSFRSWLTGSLCIVVTIVTVGAIGFDVMRRAEGMRIAGTSAKSLLSARAGTHVKAVLRVETEADGGTFAAEILQSTQGAEYRETGTQIRLALSSGTRFIMGASPDVKSGAIIEVDGAMDGGDTLRAAKIVVLNDYVHLTR